MTHINTLKGLSILLIVAFHICGQIFHGEPLWFRTLSYQGVNIFFLLSGLGLTSSILSRNLENQKVKDWINWYLKRGVRILPLYWLILLITLLFFLFDSNIIRIAVNKQNGNGLFDFVTHFFLIHIYFKKTYYSINVAWWFLAIIVHFYLLFPFIITFFKHKVLRLPLIVIVMIAYHLNKQYHFINNQILFSFVNFFIGVCLAYFNINNINRYIKRFSFVLLLTSLCLTILFICSVYGKIHEIYSPYTPELFTLSFASCLYMFSFILVDFSKKILNYSLLSLSLVQIVANKLNNVFEFLGSCSYALFLMHWGFIYPVISYFKSPILGIMVYAVFVLFLSQLFTIVDQRITSFLTAKLSTTKNSQLLDTQ